MTTEATDNTAPTPESPADLAMLARETALAAADAVLAA